MWMRGKWPFVSLAAPKLTCLGSQTRSNPQTHPFTRLRKRQSLLTMAMTSSPFPMPPFNETFGQSSHAPESLSDAMRDVPAEIVQASEKKMHSSLAGSIGKPAEDWLTLAIDPYHDRKVPLKGAPSFDGPSSIVEEVNGAFTVVPPINTTTGEPLEEYDINISYTSLATTFKLLVGEVGAQPAAAGLGRVPVLVVNGVPPAPFRVPDADTIGALTVVTNAVGRPTAPSNDLAKHANFATNPHLHVRGLSPVTVEANGQVSRDLMDGRARLISAGFEVRPITAQLNISGGAIAYEQNSRGTPMLMQDGGGYLSPTTTTRAAPSTFDDANLLPGGVPLAGVEGAYVIARLANKDFMADQPTPDWRLISGGDYMPGSYGVSGPELIQRVWTGAGNGGVQLTHTNPFTGRGYYATGVRGNILITYRFVVERFPTLDDPAVLLVAGRSAPDEPSAITSYLDAMARGPTGFKVGDNFAGLAFARMAANLVAPKVITVGKKLLGSAASATKAAATRAARDAAIAARTSVAESITTPRKTAQTRKRKPKRPAPKTGR